MILHYYYTSTKKNKINGRVEKILEHRIRNSVGVPESWQKKPPLNALQKLHNWSMKPEYAI